MRDIKAHAIIAILAFMGPLEGAIPPRGHAWKRALAGEPRRPRPGFGRAGGRDEACHGEVRSVNWSAGRHAERHV